MWGSVKIESTDEEILEDKNEMILIRKETSDRTLDHHELPERQEFVRNASLRSI